MVPVALLLCYRCDSIQFFSVRLWHRMRTDRRALLQINLSLLFGRTASLTNDDECAHVIRSTYAILSFLRLHNHLTITSLYLILSFRLNRSIPLRQASFYVTFGGTTSPSESLTLKNVSSESILFKNVHLDCVM